MVYKLRDMGAGSLPGLCMYGFVYVCTWQAGGGGGHAVGKGRRGRNGFKGVSGGTEHYIQYQLQHGKNISIGS